MISGLIPGGVQAVEAYRARWEITLLPEEAALVVTAARDRRLEFSAGRNCARQVLARLDWPGARYL